jgi:hypothetical protein
MKYDGSDMNEGVHFGLLYESLKNSLNLIVTLSEFFLSLRSLL